MIRIGKFLKSQDGFTLMEAVIVILVVTVLSFIVVDIIYLQVVNFNQVFNRSILMSEWRRALSQLRVDVPEIVPDNIVTMQGNRLTFTDLDGKTIDYEYSSNKLKRNGVVTADWVQADPFKYLDKNQNITTDSDSLTFVRVTLDFDRNGKTVQMSELLYLRN
jgi:competence protein ComGF